MSGITKSFGGVRACDQVDFDLAHGEVHALLGENGAGKSTLMNILSGALAPDDGRIEIEGRPVRFAGPSNAHDAGVAIIHQELDLVPELTVADNMFLGRERRTRLGTVDRSRTMSEARSCLRGVGIEIDPGARVSSLRVGEQQLVAVAKALSLDARILIMDEPTSALTDNDVQRLFGVVRSLRDGGVGIIYISHRLEEIDALADRVTVLRSSRRVGTVDPHETPQREIIRMMVGREIEHLFREHGSEKPGAADEAEDLLLRIDNLSVTPRHPVPGRTHPAGVSLSIRRGEIVGLSGLLGAGRTELLEELYGAAPAAPRTGTVTVEGRPVHYRSPREALAAGVCMVPEDRRAAGLFMSHSVSVNVLLAALGDVSHGGIVSKVRARAAVEKSVTDLGIRASSVMLPVGALSGGNQQKVVFARQLLVKPKLLLLDDPTRGVDVGAKAEIYQLLSNLAEQGLGILMASSEIPELLGVCDRIVVLRDGHVVIDRPAAELTQEDVLAAAMETDEEELAG
ncbi:MAG: sugar ABC transporter ATP-binding protein [Marmoricola sp.]